VRALKGLAVSALARVEVPAAFWRKHRSGDLDAADAALITQSFEADFWGGDDRPRFAVSLVTAEILDAAAAVVATHGLRAYDAVQLASATFVRNLDPDCDTFVTFDKELRRAASATGFSVLPKRL
jgi:hypothetical protein